jgi:heme exporter protein D
MWWQAFGRWLNGPEISLAVIPLHGNPINAIRKLRKALRDVRDRTARRDRRWAAVAIAGLVDPDRDRMLLRVRHHGIDRVGAWATLRRRWPDVVLGSPGDIAPSSAMTVQDAAALARCRRGLEPIRIIILHQVIVLTLQEQWDEPMPMAF